MALVVKDRVKVYSSTTGTGTLSLGSAFAGFQTFNNALGDGDTTYYGIFESSTGEFEVGIGTFTSSGNTLSRDTVLESSNTGAKVNLTADTEVFITYPAEKSVYFDANGDVNLTRDPQSSLQAATKQYVDTIAAAGLHYHAPVRVEHPSNLTATYDNGTSGVGATLTNSGTQAVLVLDGVTMVVSDRVLVANQTNQAHNGVYTVTNIGSASTNWVLTRATDADSYGPSDPDAFGEGDAFFIKEGDTNAGHLDVMTTSGEIVFGTTNIVFSEVAETTVYSAGNGLSLSGTEFNVGPGTGITVNATTVSTVQDIATSATPQFDGLTTTGNITFGDNDKAIFGAGSDLQIYHDGLHSYISDQGTGNLRILAGEFNVKSASGNTDLIYAVNGGSVYLYYNGNTRITTNATGTDFVGTITADGLAVDGSMSLTSTAPQITLIENDTTDLNTFINNSSGQFTLRTTNDAVNSFTKRLVVDHATGDISFYEDTGTTAKFFWDASAESLGIGTTSPSSILHLSSAQATVRTITESTNAAGYVGYRATNGTGYWEMQVDGANQGLRWLDDGSERMRIDSAGRVGIGTSSPASLLHLDQGSGGNGLRFERDSYDTMDIELSESGLRIRNETDGRTDVLIDGSGNLLLGSSTYGGYGPLQVGSTSTTSTVIQMLSSSGGYNTIHFGDGTSGTARYRGYVQYNHTDEAMLFATSATEAMRIDSSGNLLVGKTSSNTSNDGTTIFSSGYLATTVTQGTANSGSVAQFRRGSTDGSIVNFLKDGTTVGSIGIQSSGFYIDGESGHAGVRFAGDAIVPRDAGADTNGTTNIGAINNKWQDLYLSGSLSDGTTSRTVSDIVGTTSSQFLRSDANDTASGDITFTGFVTFDNDASPAVKIVSDDFAEGLEIHRNHSANAAAIKFSNTSGQQGILFSNSSGDINWRPLATTNNYTIWTSGNDGSGSGLDADTVDGIQASSFLRSDANDTYTGVVTGNRLYLGGSEITASSAKLQVNGFMRTGTIYLHESTPSASNDGALSINSSGVLLWNANTVWHAGNDGSGSGLDADTVDGIQGSSFLRSDADDTATGVVTFDNDTGINVVYSTSDTTSITGYGIISNRAAFYLRPTTDNTSTLYVGGSDASYDWSSIELKVGNNNNVNINGNTVWNDGNTATVIDQTTDITNNDWNDYINGTEASWARVMNMSGSNKPPNYTYGTALNISMSGSNKFQLYASHTGSDGNGLYFRTGWNTDYRGWAKIYDSVAHPALSYVDVAAGNYGTIRVDDDRGVNWAGYSIRDAWVFMGRTGDCGIYNDTDNEWSIYIAANAGTSLYYNGTATFATVSGGAAATGTLTATGDITAYFSDERLKDFDGKIDGALDKVSQLNGYYYRENDKAKELGFDNDDRQVGVSAQEVEAVLPEVIKPAPVDPEYKTVQYEKLVPLLIEAIKELKEEVRQLKEDKA